MARTNSYVTRKFGKYNIMFQMDRMTVFVMKIAVYVCMLTVYGYVNGVSFNFN